jgi:hypothetical protein
MKLRQRICARWRTVDNQTNVFYFVTLKFAVIPYHHIINELCLGEHAIALDNSSHWVGWLIRYCKQIAEKIKFFVINLICIKNVLEKYFCRLEYSLCTAVTLDEARERTSVSWMHNPCSDQVDSSQVWGPASDWTVLYLNNLWQIKLFHWLIDN